MTAAGRPPEGVASEERSGTVVRRLQSPPTDLELAIRAARTDRHLADKIPPLRGAIEKVIEELDALIEDQDQKEIPLQPVDKGARVLRAQLQAWAKVLCDKPSPVGSTDSPPS